MNPNGPKTPSNATVLILHKVSEQAKNLIKSSF